VPTSGSTTGGINGTALFAAAVGGVLVYAGFAGVSPAAALRSISTGRPAAPGTQPVLLAGTDLGIVAAGVAGNALRSQVVAAAGKYMGDRYSQLRRRQPGWSDCSSFVDKCLRDAGIKPPYDPWANTTLYLMSPEWRTIPAAAVLPGDIAVAVGHMVLITAAGAAMAVGQENPRINVRTGPPGSLFSRSEHYVFKTWRGYSAPGVPRSPGLGTSTAAP
jgi:hypothetical protein